MAVVIAIAFELIVAVQSIVFLVAPLAGLLIGGYADSRSERRRPWLRVVANAAYAGLITGIGLALLYGSIRLLFVYADSGYRDPGLGGQIAGCATGPACTYQRYLEAGRGGELEAAGVRDAAAFERHVVGQQLTGAVVLVGLTTVGAVAGGVLYGMTAGKVPDEEGARAA